MRRDEPPATARLLAGDRRAIAHAISALENDAPGADDLQRALAPQLGRACVLGITGPPGAGKSTLINALLGEMLARDLCVGVVAVDPSSPITGGAVLGDRARMGEHGGHDRVFIRSLSTRGHAGGLARRTDRVVDVLDAAGFDVVIVETVGAGQSEVAIADLADTRIVACPPGLGDALQAIKAGILEIADVLVVTKGDVPGADATRRDLADMLRLRRGGSDVPVLTTIATRGDGIAQLVDAAIAHADRHGRGQRLRARRNADANGERVARLSARDPFVRALGIECIGGGPGCATTRLRIAPHHVNFNGGCHGGAIFALADAAFGLASNSHGTTASGIEAHIAFHVGVREGDVLTARATEIARGNKLATYRVDVTRDDATLVASFSGTVYVSARTNEPASAEAAAPPE
ncbi:MAG TPA: methylmalonyl Co-A mutase-associated GTPase MeaB [Casimicrobiaceae bacterium]|nr:methylmalonyl Co-A mutase-associated GTPase MeaB [Casimicrobiaceae bacterium]